MAAAFRLAGTSTTVLRGTAALVGVAGVLALWPALRRFGRAPALAGMAWAAGSLWLICVSRDGFRNIITVAFGALALAALLRWGDRPGRPAAALAGAAVALGLWAYGPLRLTPLLVLAWLWWIHRVDRDRYRRLRAGLGWAVAGYLVVAAPMIWTAITDFGNFFGRDASVSAFNPTAGAAQSFPDHVLRTLGMFFVTGDPNPRHDVAALPLLGPVLCIPFLLGIWRCWQRRRDHGHALLLLGLGVYLLAPLLATEGDAPHFLRSLGLAPVVAGLVGLGCVQLVAWVRRVTATGPVRLRRSSGPLAAALCAAVLVLLGVLSLRTYLQRPLSDRYDAYSFADVQLAGAADHGAATVVIVDAYDALDVRFLDIDAEPTVVDPSQRLRDPAVYTLIVAPSQADIAAVAGAQEAARATVAARDPQGHPVVWEVVPQ